MLRPCVGSDRKREWVLVVMLVKGLSSLTPKMMMKFQRWDKEKKATSSGRESIVTYVRLVNFWEGKGWNERKIPWFSRHVRHLCAWGANGQRDLKMSTGPLKSWFVYWEISSGMVGQAYLGLADLSESLSDASSPSH